MRTSVFIFLLLILNTSLGQDTTKFRFEYGISGLSILHYGLKNLNDISTPNYGSHYQVYQTEKYTLDYENFNFSSGIDYHLGMKIISKNQYTLKLSSHFFVEKFSEKMTYTLTDIGDGSTIDYGVYTTAFSSQDIQLGYQNTITFKSDRVNGFGYAFDLIFLKSLKRNYYLGGGLFYYFHKRPDWIYEYTTDYYLPIGYSIGRGNNNYRTMKIGIALEFQKHYKRFNGFINLSQTILATKKEDKKGGIEYYNEYSIAPISQNLDYRFPLIFRLGLSIEFGRIK